MKNFRILLVVGLIAYALNPSFSDTNDLSLGHQILLKTGLQIQAQVFPKLEDTQEVVGFDRNRWAESNFTTVNFQWYRYGTNFFGGNELQWARWGGGTITPTYAEAAYLPQLVGIQIGDEQDLISGEMSAVATKIASYVAVYPDKIIYTNQSPLYNNNNAGVTVSLLSEYMQAANPGMLCFSEYPFRWEDTGSSHDYDGGSPTEMYEHLEVYRKASLLGNDGTGNKPIPFGLYVETFIDNRAGLNHRTPSESQMRLNQFSAWAFGAKQVSAFVYDQPLSTDTWQAALFEGVGDSNPTAEFYMYAELNRQSRNLGDALVRLISTDVRMKMGKHDSDVVNDLPDGVTAWDASADNFLKSVSATNMGTLNNGQAGDVIVGFFKPLDASLVEEGAENDIYFMILNGLTDENGSAEACEQSIHLEFDFSGTEITQLLRLSRDTGEVEIMDLIDDGDGLYHLDITLDGGTGDLFKYDTGTAFVPEPTMTLVMISMLYIMSKRKKRD